MLIEADGVVEAITTGGYIDHFDTGQVAIFDVVSLAISSGAGGSTLRVVLDGQQPDEVQWQLGLRVQFRIEDHLVHEREPVFSGTLQDLRVVGDV